MKPQLGRSITEATLAARDELRGVRELVAALGVSYELNAALDRLTESFAEALYLDPELVTDARDQGVLADKLRDADVTIEALERDVEKAQQERDEARTENERLVAVIRSELGLQRPTSVEKT